MNGPTHLGLIRRRPEIITGGACKPRAAVQGRKTLQTATKQPKSAKNTKTQLTLAEIDAKPGGGRKNRKPCSFSDEGSNGDNRAKRRHDQVRLGSGSATEATMQPMDAERMPNRPKQLGFRWGFERFSWRTVVAEGEW
ncbi:hypothetical protein V6N13_139294 [Hibiscus sabdariffa]